jgi:hypothetical protein
MNTKNRNRFVLLLSIISIFILCGNAFSAQNRGKSVAGNLLPKELKGITINDYFLESSGKEIAAIQGVEGTLVVERPDAKQAYFAATGDKLYENDILYTLKKSRCKFQLITQDNVSMGENTRIVIKEVVDNQATASKSSLFGMVRGMAIFYTVRVSSYFTQSMQVETPTAVSGVRGSKFGVQIKPAAARETTSAPVLLADASDNSFIYLAQAEAENNKTVTVVHGMEGQVEVKSKKDNSIQFLNPGQSIEATISGLGKIFATPAKVIKQFMGSVEINLAKVGKELEKTSKKAEKKLEKPAGQIDKLGKDLEKKFKF